ncbi:MAG: hypothetical protein HPY66_0759 [Firmicutes bacterium]|nr:hypothetical protein [Bacillota bacterium]MDI6705685.1 anti-sigma regulatory factor [Bacillota bacterium]
MGEMVKLEYRVSSEDFERAGDASSNTKKVLKKIGIPSDVIRRAAIVTYEAEMNLVIHSMGGEIVVEIFPDRIIVTAKDFGPGIPDVDKAMQEGYSTAPDRIREMGFGAGMGLPNMKKCSDDFSIESEVGVGTEVVMTLYI